jgi:hypothetical protein
MYPPEMPALNTRLAALLVLLEQLQTTHDTLLRALARGDRAAAITLLAQIRAWRAASATVQAARDKEGQSRRGAVPSPAQAHILALAETLTTHMVSLEIVLQRRPAQEEVLQGRLPRPVGHLLAWWHRRR